MADPGADPRSAARAGTPAGAGAAPGVVADLSPAYFGLVMATGIVSLAAEMRGLHRFGLALFALNIAAWLVLSGLYAARAVLHPRRFFGDLADHLRAPGYFTAVAGTCVLATQVLVFLQGRQAAFALGWCALLLWLTCTYSVFAAFTIKTEKPPLDKGISGAWLLAVVSTQSLALLSALLAPHTVQPFKMMANFFALSMWLWGGMLYIWLMSLIFYRYTFFRLAPEDLSPPYWINMGAMAISTLAGSFLILNAPDAPFLAAILPFLKGFTILYWATATWWIPMLLILGVWRYGYMRFPLRYDPQYWGAVFPLGMYSAATHELSEAFALNFLSAVSHAFLYAGIIAWALAAAGLARRIVRHALRSGTAVAR